MNIINHLTCFFIGQEYSWNKIPVMKLFPENSLFVEVHISKAVDKEDNKKVDCDIHIPDRYRIKEYQIDQREEQSKTYYNQIPGVKGEYNFFNFLHSQFPVKVKKG